MLSYYEKQILKNFLQEQIQLGNEANFPDLVEALREVHCFHREFFLEIYQGHEDIYDIFEKLIGCSAELNKMLVDINALVNRTCIAHNGSEKIRQQHDQRMRDLIVQIVLFFARLLDEQSPTVTIV